MSTQIAASQVSDLVVKDILRAIARDLDALFTAYGAAPADIDAVVTEINRLGDRSRSEIVATGTLAIGAVSKAKLKNTTTVYAIANGTLASAVAAETALSGTVTNAKYNVYQLFIDSSGTLTTAMGTEGASLGAVVFPTQTADKASVGFVIVHPTGTGDFVGGTTELDDGTVVPNAVYVNTVGFFNPEALDVTPVTGTPPTGLEVTEN